MWLASTLRSSPVTFCCTGMCRATLDRENMIWQSTNKHETPSRHAFINHTSRNNYEPFIINLRKYNTGWWFGCHFLFSHIYIGNNHPNWFSYCSEGFKPPTRTYHHKLMQPMRVYSSWLDFTCRPPPQGHGWSMGFGDPPCGSETGQQHPKKKMEDDWG